MPKLRLVLLFAFFLPVLMDAQPARLTEDFTKGWKFYLGNAAAAAEPGYNDAAWRSLQLPHDWSIELPFDPHSPTGTGGGALRGGTGWYRKIFTLPLAAKGKQLFIDFDGVYCNSEVFINGHSLGVRPNGYISFRYELTPYIRFGNEINVIAVKVNNEPQPNSRWYSGSGIYRNVWLVTLNSVFVDHWGTAVTTPLVNEQAALVKLQTTLRNTGAASAAVVVKTKLVDAVGKVLQTQSATVVVDAAGNKELLQQFSLPKPSLWSVEHPYSYKAITQVMVNGKVMDEYTTPFGLRSFHFDVNKGFFLNGRHLKIRGVCMHHDLGCLGTAINTRALERQLEILKAMGCNAIRTSHNPPAPELLSLCDKMGFIVMDEAFDMWKKEKNPYDYHLSWDAWHEKDLQDQIRRDRNHPSVFIWSAGNEIVEQWGEGKDTSGRKIVRELVHIIRSLDTTRPIVTANNETGAWNNLLMPGVTDITGYNYHDSEWATVLKRWPGKPFIVTESVSSLQTRGHYDMPSDSIRRWPVRWDLPFTTGNADTTCSAYDNCSAPWGSTHEETMKVFEKYDHISGMFIWTGFDYIGEPTPYAWPARSSYFGIVDLAGFPKDVYYMYQSIWTDKPVLHILPHWNWKTGDSVDVWAYYSQADEVELLLNGRSLGAKRKTGDELHVMWRVKYEPGTLRAVSKKGGNIVLVREVKTAGVPAKIMLSADRKLLKAGGKDLSFVTVKIIDKDGNLVPDAANQVQFQLTGAGAIAGVDNGSQTSMESFKANQRKAFNGLCLAVLQAGEKAGAIRLTVTSPGLKAAVIDLVVQ